MTTIRSAWISADNAIPIEERTLESEGLYRQLQQAVGGFIEAVTLSRAEATLYCNEEGKLNRLPINNRATQFVWTYDPRFVAVDVIVGDVVVVGLPDDEGYDTTLPDQTLAELLNDDWTTTPAGRGNATDKGDHDVPG